MWKYILYATFLVLSGCGALQVANYDVGEYTLINKIHTTAQIVDCKPERYNKLTEMLWLSVELRNYSQHLPNNEITYKMTVNLLTLINELNTRISKNQSVSEVYCQDKLNIIVMSAEEIQKVVGRKPR